MILKRYAVAVLCLAFTAAAQQREIKEPAFEAVSVKSLGANQRLGPGPLMLLGLRFTPSRVSGNSQIPALIEDAYSVKPFQIVLPEMEAEDIALHVYEIAAVMPDGTSRANARAMLRSLLAERFGLRYHRETREISVYALIAPGRTKLTPIDPEKARQHPLETPMGTRERTLSAGGPGWWAAASATMDQLAGNVGFHLDRPVIDETGLTGTYSIQLRWDSTDDTSIILAIEHDLGLKLEKRKIPYEMFVVDHVALTPTAN